MLDVAVIGAGPSGSRVAYRLAQYGYKTAVLEKRAAAGLKIACTGILSQECISKFNIPLDVVYRQVSSAQLISPSGISLRITRPEVQACVVNRSALDLHLAGLAQTRGADYRYNTRVEELDVQADRVVLYTTSKGRSLVIEARAVVLACGFNTPLVKKAGFGSCLYFTTGVQTEVQTGSLAEIEIYFGRHLAPGFFAWLVPTREGHALAGLMSRRAPGPHLRTWLTSLAAYRKIEFEESKINYAGIPMYPLKRTYNNRLIVVGDAAGQTKPTTGGGIYFGLLCADIAAETLHKGLSSGDLSSDQLSVYQQDWHNLLKKELRAEYLARRAYQLLTDARIDKLFTSAKAEGWLDGLVNTSPVAFDWHGKALAGLVRSALKTTISARIRRAKFAL